MKQTLNIHEYKPEIGLEFEWEQDYKISVLVENDCVLIKANSAGLISLARHLLTLAQNGVPPGNHLHMDELDSLEHSSTELILEKM